MLFDFASSGWSSLSMDVDDQNEIGVGMLETICEAFGRLVFYYSQPCFELLQVAGETGGDVDAHIRKIAQPVRALSERCPQCVDRIFSMIWLRRLEDARQRVRIRARNVLATIGALAAPNSGAAERRHLHGIETRYNKRRGRAVNVPTVGKHTYVKGVREEHGARTARFKASQFGKGKDGVKINKRFLNTLKTSYCGGGDEERKSRYATGDTTRTKRVRILPHPSKKMYQVSGYSHYISKKFHLGPTVDDEGQPIHSGKRTHVVAKRWKDLPDAEKVDYNEKASAENKKAEVDANKDLVEVADLEYTSKVGKHRVVKNACRVLSTHGSTIQSLQLVQVLVTVHQL